MNLAARPWIVAVILGLLALSLAHAGMAPEEMKAFEGYKVLAEKGVREAQYNLGLCYDKGEGVAKDQVEAYAYFNLAAVTDEDARKNLEILKKKLSPEALLRGQQRAKELQKEIEANFAAKKAGK